MNESRWRSTTSTAANSASASLLTPAGQRSGQRAGRGPNGVADALEPATAATAAEVVSAAGWSMAPFTRLCRLR
jgi:hypothetical protein